MSLPFWPTAAALFAPDSYRETNTLLSFADGYKSLLIEAEGGQAIELVTEENGILISMLLRQYFMSLRVLNRWTHLGPHMAQHWHKVASSVAECHPTLDPTASPSGPVAAGTANSNNDNKTTAPSSSSSSSWAHFHPATMRARRASVGPLSEHETDMDGASPPARALEGLREEEEEGGQGAGDDAAEERELAVMRRVFRRWCRRAGVHASAAVDPLDEGEMDCDWTRAVAPKVEGRIVMLGEGA